ncbi:hypothetical protein H0H92_006584 [Tricholoma furcatifolium]|nr:hypothetical protein H0H92_006584 [Tricholoma furcatifolium]
MASSPTQKPFITYADALRSLNGADVQADLNSAFEQFALTTARLLESFDNVARQLHTVDLLGFAPPFKPQWILLCKCSLRWFFLSQRATLRLLDRMTRNFKHYNHATLTRSLVGSAMKFNNSLNTFHTEYSKFLSIKAPGGHQELRELAQKLTDLESNIRQYDPPCLYSPNAKHSGSEVAHFTFSVYRSCALATRKSSRSRASHKRLTTLALSQALNTPELVAIGRLYEQLDLIRSEVAHAQYTAQVHQRKTDALTSAQTTMSTLVSDEMISLESCLSLFLSTWSRLHVDCTEILRWLQNPRSFPETPGAIVGLLDGNHTLYTAVADALDTLVMGIDPSSFSSF